MRGASGDGAHNPFEIAIVKKLSLRCRLTGVKSDTILHPDPSSLLKH